MGWGLGLTERGQEQIAEVLILLGDAMDLGHGPREISGVLQLDGVRHLSPHVSELSGKFGLALRSQGGGDRIDRRAPG